MPYASKDHCSFLRGFCPLTSKLSTSFGLFVEHFLCFFEGNFLRILVFGDFDVVKTARTLDVRAIGAVDDPNVAPVSVNRDDCVLIKPCGGGKINGIGVVIFDLDVVFAGFEVGTEGAA